MTCLHLLRKGNDTQILNDTDQHLPAELNFLHWVGSGSIGFVKSRRGKLGVHSEIRGKREGAIFSIIVWH